MECTSTYGFWVTSPALIFGSWVCPGFPRSHGPYGDCDLHRRGCSVKGSFALLIGAEIGMSRNFTTPGPCPEGHQGRRRHRQRPPPLWGASNSCARGEASDLRPGIWLRTSTGTYVQITATKTWITHHQRVHNLSVAGAHTYYVEAGDASFLVHDDRCPVTSRPHSRMGETASLN